MPGNFKKNDLRVIKTRKVIFASLTKLLEIQNFNNLTIQDLCEKAQISRSTFYEHFMDKYDLLEHWLTQKKANAININRKDAYGETEKNINDFVNKNKNIIKNLIENANGETNKLLCNFLLSLLRIDMDKTGKWRESPNDIVLSTVCGGALLNYVSWQVENKFPSNLPMMNPYIYEFLIHMQKWKEDQSKNLFP